MDRSAENNSRCVYVRRVVTNAHKQPRFRACYFCRAYDYRRVSKTSAGKLVVYRVAVCKHVGVPSSSTHIHMTITVSRCIDKRKKAAHAHERDSKEKDTRTSEPPCSRETGVSTSEFYFRSPQLRENVARADRRDSLIGNKRGGELLGW